MESHFGVGINLWQAVEAEVAAGRSLEMAYLVGAPLAGSFLSRGPKLRAGIFIRANFTDARLSYSDLEKANLAYANFENAYLSQCNLAGTNLIGTRLFNAKLRGNSFVGAIGLRKESFKGLKWGWFPIYQMLEDYPEQCEAVYRALATHFASEALFDDVSWAAYRSCVMRHSLLTRRLSATTLWAQEFLPVLISDPEKASQMVRDFPGVSKRRFSVGFVASRTFAMIEWLKSLFLRMVMGYGEKPLRVLGNAALVMLLYALVYYKFGAIGERPFLSSLYFSVVTFTTVGYGDLAPRGAFRLIAASEALVGILLSGLFLFCLGRRSVSRA